MQLIELRSIAIEFLKQGDAIRQTNVAPHFGVAGGNAREVAEAAGGKTEQQVTVIAQRKVVDKRIRQEMRQVADGGENPVVFLGPQLVNDRPAPLPS